MRCERELPILAHQIVSEAMVTLFLDQAEAGALIEVAGSVQNIVGP
jgi:hypothetical protein